MTSRPYFGANKMAEGSASRLSYIEVLNGQHFETFLGVAGYDTRFIPLHYYVGQGLNLMWNHLRNGSGVAAVASCSDHTAWWYTGCSARDHDGQFASDLAGPGSSRCHHL